MPIYTYRAVDKNGIVLTSKVQEKSKQNLIKRLKANELTPIHITQTSFGKYKQGRNKATNINELMNIASETSKMENKNSPHFYLRAEFILIELIIFVFYSIIL